jgi:hypothetical protein
MTESGISIRGELKTQRQWEDRLELLWLVLDLELLFWEMLSWTELQSNSFLDVLMDRENGLPTQHFILILLDVQELGLHLEFSPIKEFL